MAGKSGFLDQFLPVPLHKTRGRTESLATQAEDPSPIGSADGPDSPAAILLRNRQYSGGTKDADQAKRFFRQGVTTGRLGVTDEVRSLWSAMNLGEAGLGPELRDKLYGDY